MAQARSMLMAVVIPAAAFSAIQALSLPRSRAGTHREGHDS